LYLLELPKAAIFDRVFYKQKIAAFGSSCIQGSIPGYGRSGSMLRAIGVFA
jgi:hypothetical protein